MTNQPAGAPPAKPRLLFIDDNQPLRNAFSRMLRTDFEVVAVASAEEAVTLLGSGARFDALVTDLEMPNCDGFQTVACISSFDVRLAKRAVICTGAHMTDAERAAHAANGTVIVSKSAASTALVDAIRAQIAKHP